MPATDTSDANPGVDPQTARRILRQQGVTDALLGVEFAPKRLYVVPLALRASPATAQTVPVQAPAQRPVSQRPPSYQNEPDVRFAVGATTKPPATAAPLPLARAQREPIPAGLSRAERIKRLQEIDEQEVRGCERCGLCRGRTRTVFGEGDAEAEIMFVGEGPGQQEDLQGRPFVGRAGDLLDKQIEAMGFLREQVYIANVVKCRPPNNRAPTPEEADACADFLARQIEIIRPKAIITLGGPAAKRLLGTTQGVTRLRGTWHAYREIDPEIPVMPTFHPAYVLRNYTKDTRMKVWSDLKALCEKIGKPVGG